MFLVGRFADKHGQKKTIIIVAVLLALSCIWNSFVSSLWMLIIGFFLGRISGQGSMVLLPSAIVPQWFYKKRALAISIMSLGGVVGSALIPPLNSALIGIWGWNPVWWLWAALLILFFIPIVYLFLYDKPEDLGLRADNCTAIDAASKKHNIDADCESFTIKEAMRYKSFWGMLFCQMLLPLIITGVVFHFISIAEVKGLSETSSSFILSLFAIVSFPATLAAGYLLDRIKMHHAAALMCGLQLASLLVLLFSTSIVSAILFAAIQGTALGLQSVCSGVIWPNYFGTKHITSIRGLSMAALVIGSSLGPIPFGFVFDASGNYNLAIVLMMILSVMGVVAALLSPKPVKQA